jgi:hypothetical protein
MTLFFFLAVISIGDCEGARFVRLLVARLVVRIGIKRRRLLLQAVQTVFPDIRSSPKNRPCNCFGPSSRQLVLIRQN